MTDVWGPWQDHDGKGYPEDAIGRLCQVVDISVKGISDPSEPFMCDGDCPDGGSWNWGNQNTTDIFAYRIAKPKGMIVLDEILESLEGKSASDLVVMLVELRQTQREGTGR